MSKEKNFIEVLKYPDTAKWLVLTFSYNRKFVDCIKEISSKERKYLPQQGNQWIIHPQHSEEIFEWARLHFRTALLTEIFINKTSTITDMHTGAVTNVEEGIEGMKKEMKPSW